MKNANRITAADLDDAKFEGATAARYGRSPMSNPYRNGDLFRAWSEGHTRGYRPAVLSNDAGQMAAA